MEDSVLLAHGGGGIQSHTLIERIFKAHFSNPYFTPDDAATLPIEAKNIAFSTDGFIVSPYMFPKSNIGKLSICGTVNDIACMGARPKWLSCAFVLEEGFPLKDLEEIARSMAETAREAGVHIVAGDTKVASKGQVDHIFITTTGIGEIIAKNPPRGSRAMDGDAIIVTGDIGRHGATILVARNEFGIEADLSSDCAPLGHLVESLYGAGLEPHVIRDATRGGVGTVLYEIARQSEIGIRLRATDIPVDPRVSGICQMLGLDPLYLACEGRLCIFAPEKDASAIVKTLRSQPYGQGATIIGHVDSSLTKGSVVIETALGAPTLLPQPTGELLPRIC